MIRLAAIALLALMLAACSQQSCPAPAAKAKAPAPAQPVSALWPKKAPVVAAPKAAPRAAPAPRKAKAAKVKKPKAKAKAVAKIKTADPKLAAWCARVPAGTAMWQIEFAAAARGKTLTAKDRERAQACLASK